MSELGRGCVAEQFLCRCDIELPTSRDIVGTRTTKMNTKVKVDGR